LTVTEDGQKYLHRIAPLLEELGAAHEDAQSTRIAPSGVLRITASVAFAYELIVPHLPVFQAQYPDIIVDLQSTDTTLNLVENGIDLAIRLAPAPTGDLISTRLLQPTYKLVASPEYMEHLPLGSTPLELTNANCIRYALPHSQDQWSFQRGDDPAFVVPVSGNLICSNALALRRAVIEGLGVGLMADWLAADALSTGALQQAYPDYTCVNTELGEAAWALYPSRAYLPRKVRVMIDFLRTILKDTA
jgi:DNA-binding transcriptional LysR family regulator